MLAAECCSIRRENAPNGSANAADGTRGHSYDKLDCRWCVLVRASRAPARTSDNLIYRSNPTAARERARQVTRKRSAKCGGRARQLSRKKKDWTASPHAPPQDSPVAPRSAIRAPACAVGEAVILLHPPLPLAGVSIETKRECQQNVSLADGCSSPSMCGTCRASDSSCVPDETTRQRRRLSREGSENTQGKAGV